MQETIQNCQLKADILPNDDDDNDNDENSTDIQIELKRLRELKEVQVLIDKLIFDDPLTAEEFVRFDKSETTGEMISDEEIVKAVLPEPNELENEEEEDPLPTITHNEAIEAYDKVILYLDQWEEVFNVNKKELKLIKKLKKEALKQQFISVRQTNLNNFVTIFE